MWNKVEEFLFLRKKEKTGKIVHQCHFSDHWQVPRGFTGDGPENDDRAAPDQLRSQ